MTDDRPKLAVLWEEASFAPMVIAAAARGTCRLIWVVGWSRWDSALPLRLLHRLGQVADISGQDEAGVMAMLKPLAPDGVIVFTDEAQVLAARIARHLGLEFNSEATARALSDKLEQRRVLQAAGVPVPRFAPVQRSDGYGIGGLRHNVVRFPAVLKPRQGAGSRDVFLVGDQGELVSALALSRDEELVLEELIPDREPRLSLLGADVISVETVVDRGRPVHAGVSGRFLFDPPFRETGSFLPCDLPADEVAGVEALATAAAEALGVAGGGLHVEVKLAPDGPQVIEVNGRLGGGVPGMFENLAGPSLMTAAMRVALGLPAGTLVPLACSPVTFVRWWLPPVGARRLVSARGLSAAAALPGVKSVWLTRQPGDEVDFRAGGAHGQVVVMEGTVPDHQALSELLRAASECVLLRFSEE